MPPGAAHGLPTINVKVSDGARTRDNLDHNQELYQLSYAHRVGPNLAECVGCPPPDLRFTRQDSQRADQRNGDGGKCEHRDQPG